MFVNSLFGGHALDASRTYALQVESTLQLNYLSAIVQLRDGRLPFIPIYLRDCPNVRSTFYLHKYTLDDRWMERRVLSICSSIIQKTTIPIWIYYPEVADMFGSNHRSLFRYFSHLQVDGRFSDVTTCRSLLIMLSIFENTNTRITT